MREVRVNSVERLNAIMEGRTPDRWPWVPSIYEHGAAVLGRSPAEVSRDPDLMARAAVESFERYGHDVVTVGIDIYNVEAEALGCDVSRGGRGVPGVISHPLRDADLEAVRALEVPEPGPSNRLGTIAEAAGRVVERLGGRVWVYACMGGPFSQAVELRGFEQFITDLYTWPEIAHALLEKTTRLSVEQAGRLSRRGAGIYLYESWATIPLINGEIFEECVVPGNREVISRVREGFDTPPPGVIMGGDTAKLMDFLLAADTSIVVADYNTDFDYVRERVGDRNIIVRGCVDPKMIERGDWQNVERSVRALAEKARGMHNFVWGCGCVPLDTPPEHVLQFKKLCLESGRS